jgi:hypothetical protein
MTEVAERVESADYRAIGIGVAAAGRPPVLSRSRQDSDEQS